jgi:hypothetical protein
MTLLIGEQPLTVAQLRDILADAPDDAIVRVNFHRGNERDPLLLHAFDGEYLAPEQWHDEAGVLIQTTY